MSWCAVAPRNVAFYPIRMSSERSLFDQTDPAAEAAADVRADADVQAGRVISHEAVKRWIGSWGSDKPLPRPPAGH